MNGAGCGEPATSRRAPPWELNTPNRRGPGPVCRAGGGSSQAIHFPLVREGLWAPGSISVLRIRRRAEWTPVLGQPPFRQREKGWHKAGGRKVPRRRDAGGERP